MADDKDDQNLQIGQDFKSGLRSGESDTKEMFEQKHLSDKIIKCSFFDLVFWHLKITQDSRVLISEHKLNVDQGIWQDRFHVYKKFFQKLELQVTRMCCLFCGNWMGGTLGKQ